MLKKRIIFALLYSNGYFCLSRNFKLQRIGDMRWLNESYDFRKVSVWIDELVILNLSTNNNWNDKFLDVVRALASNVFVPITVGGGIKTVNDAQKYFHNGADKILVNQLLIDDISIVKEISNIFGQQSIVGSIDYKIEKGSVTLFHKKNRDVIQSSSVLWDNISQLGCVGELLIRSVNKDGSGMGLDFSLLTNDIIKLNLPIIIAGGVGNARHVAEGLHHESVNAVCTANLLNFVGNGLEICRKQITDKENLELASW